MDKFQHYNQLLDKELSKYPVVLSLEKKLGVPKVTMALGCGVALFVLIFFNIGAQVITDLLGWVYPAYASFKAIESPSPNDDKQWLTYWTVFGFVNVIEFFVDRILSWFPFYFIFKTLFVLWLFLPTFRGAEVLYNSGLRKLLLQYAPQIEAQAKRFSENASKIIEGKSL